MRIGYSFWGFLGDKKYVGDKEVSTPDGNAAYSWAIVWEALQRGHQVLPMQRDRDADGWRLHGPEIFSAFSQDKRVQAYTHLSSAGYTFNSHIGHPDLDVILVEWRFPIPGRNTPDVKGQPCYQEDYERQASILQHYSDIGVPVIIWDLDHKLERRDEIEWSPRAIFETSVKPRLQHIARTRVEPPFVMDDLLQHPTITVRKDKMLAYVGSRYERDDVIEEYLGGLTRAHPGRVHFYGKWDAEAREKWPDVTYHDRIGMADFRSAYGDAGACPLLAKRSYIETGFITPRVWEALLFGTIPIGLSQFPEVDRYTEHFACDNVQMCQLARQLSNADLETRDVIRRRAAERLRFMDARHFVDKIESVV